MAMNAEEHWTASLYIYIYIYVLVVVIIGWLPRFWSGKCYLYRNVNYENDNKDELIQSFRVMAE